LATIDTLSTRVSGGTEGGRGKYKALAGKGSVRRICGRAVDDPKVGLPDSLVPSFRSRREAPLCLASVGYFCGLTTRSAPSPRFVSSPLTRHSFAHASWLKRPKRVVKHGY
jgi:hypothetical protein